MGNGRWVSALEVFIDCKECFLECIVMALFIGFVCNLDTPSRLTVGMKRILCTSPLSVSRMLVAVYLTHYVVARSANNEVDQAGMCIAIAIRSSSQPRPVRCIDHVISHRVRQIVMSLSPWFR